jgi:hypothetical protein
MSSAVSGNVVPNTFTADVTKPSDGKVKPLGVQSGTAFGMVALAATAAAVSQNVFQNASANHKDASAAGVKVMAAAQPKTTRVRALLESTIQPPHISVISLQLHLPNAVSLDLPVPCPYEPGRRYMIYNNFAKAIQKIYPDKSNEDIASILNNAIAAIDQSLKQSSEDSRSLPTSELLNKFKEFYPADSDVYEIMVWVMEKADSLLVKINGMNFIPIKIKGYFRTFIYASTIFFEATTQSVKV